MELLEKSFAVACLIFGFGFVVFFHELGHFLAAKWVGIKVEQFAVGFGHAIASWRKGMGITWGSSGQQLAELERQGVNTDTIGETEYRLNWIPLGGYVKMLGQDDMNPNATASDPRAFNQKSIGARMLVVSAGVILNVILAAFLFMGVFLMGHRVPAPVVGAIQTNSPAQLAGMKVGDRVIEFEGQRAYSFTSLMLNIALVQAGEPVPVIVERDGRELHLKVQPQRPTGNSKEFYSIGIGSGAVRELRGLDIRFAKQLEKLDGSQIDPGTMILPGDVITHVNGRSVSLTDYAVFDEALQNSLGQPVALTVANPKRDSRQVLVRPQFDFFFGQTSFNLAGMEPRPRIEGVLPESKLNGHLKPGDIIVAMRVNGELFANPAHRELIQNINNAGANSQTVELIVERDGKVVNNLPGVVPGLKTGEPGKRGIGFQPSLDTGRPVVVNVQEGSAAERAKLPRGAMIISVNNTPTATWFDVHAALKQSKTSASIAYVQLDAAGQPAGEPIKSTLALSDEERQTLGNIRFVHDLLLRERIEPRQTSNPVTAAAWSVTETRDMLLQFYVTLHRLTQGSVSASNFMGPIGIVHAGSLFAFKGWDWLVWFLAMISANLAVVNFLPIPIVDGGLFLFLIIEKIKGKPLSPRMQTVAQIVGLAIILSVFLFVTYQDIRRIFM